MEYRTIVPLLTYPDRMSRCLKVLAEESLDGTALKPHHVPFIFAVGTRDGVSQKELCAVIPVDKSRVSTVIHELMGLGLVYNGSSRKTWDIRLTDAGREAFRTMERGLSSLCEEIFGPVPEEDLREFVGMTVKINARVDEVMASRLVRRFPICANAGTMGRRYIEEKFEPHRFNGCGTNHL